MQRRYSYLDMNCQSGVRLRLELPLLLRLYPEPSGVSKVITHFGESQYVSGG